MTDFGVLDEGDIIMDSLVNAIFLALIMILVGAMIVLLVATQGWWAIPMITIVTVIAFALALLD